MLNSAPRHGQVWRVILQLRPKHFLGACRNSMGKFYSRKVVCPQQKLRHCEFGSNFILETQTSNFPCRNDQLQYVITSKSHRCFRGRVYLHGFLTSALIASVSLTLRPPYLRGKSANYPLAMRLYRPLSLLSQTRQKRKTSCSCS